MNDFTRLFDALGESNRTGDKLAALEAYFRAAPPEDAAWAAYFLAGGRVKRAVNTRLLREWAGEAAGIPPWLVEECHGAVGDLAETIALLLPAGRRDTATPLHEFVGRLLLPLPAMGEAEKRALFLETWPRLDARQRLVWHKLLGGGFRAGAARRLVVRAIAAVAGVDPAVVEHRMAGAWQPSAEAWRALVAPGGHQADPSQPYPFFLAHPLVGGPEGLGPVEEWQAEWKWDGIRAQVIRRGGDPLVWSRGGELLTEGFPDIVAAARVLPPGTVLDGEIVILRGEAVAPFAELQGRLGRRKPGRRLLQELPAAFIAYDCLEAGGEDRRALPLAERRALLEEIIGSVPDSGGVLSASPVVTASSWSDLAAARGESRARGVEGLMLKRRASPYGTGRVRGDWWKWKVEPFTCDCVLIHAERGHGRRAGLHTDYTFAVWDGGALVPVMKAYSGLTDEEIRRVDAFVRRHTVERFGPVRSVRPELVFELAFEGVNASRRHKSGLAVRFPRIVRWRTDKTAAEADTLDALRKLLPSGGGEEAS